MEQPFLTIYDFFHRKRGAFFGIFILLLIVLSVGSLQVRLEEDITRFFPDDKRVEKLSYIFQNSKFADRLVLMISMRDSADAPAPDSLVHVADQLSEEITRKLSRHIRHMQGKVDDSRVLEVFSSIQNNLPVYLTEDDYGAIDSLADPLLAKQRLEQNYRQLVSPGGIVMKRVIVRDPLGFSLPVLNRLQHLQFDENFELYENYVVTRDRRHLLIFIEPIYASGETKHNAAFQRELTEIANEVSGSNPAISVSFFGGSVVAVGNASQLQRDTILTVSIMIALLLIILLGFFRKKRIPFLILLPVVMGALFALSVISLIQESLSILALAVGAVILGVAVDYSLHFLVYLRESRDNREVVKHIAKPLTIGSLTTFLAFLCLQFTNASVLQDIGLFAALSLVGAALCSLVFLPHLVSPDDLPQHAGARLRSLVETSFERSKWIAYLILLLTPVFLYFAGDVRFNSDMGKLNFMNDDTREAGRRLETINNSSLSAVYVVCSDSSMENAYRQNERALSVLTRLRDNGVVSKVSSASLFLLSDSLQQVRLNRWYQALSRLVER